MKRNYYLWWLVIACLFSWPAGSAELGKPVTTGTIQLASVMPAKVKVNEYLISEKLDGIRARWTGTVLLTRNGNRIFAPAWFTAGWPAEPMDAELWSGRGEFEHIASVVMSETPDARWHSITMMVFDLPASDAPFYERAEHIVRLTEQANSRYLKAVPQFMLATQQQLEQKLDEVVSRGGEGLMLHHRLARYSDGRSDKLLKLKQHSDDEARVIGIVPGKGRFSGMMGALVVRTRTGVQFRLGSGFTLAQRRQPPETGTWVTFKHYGFIRRGIPRFASFLRQRPARDLPATRPDANRYWPHR